MTSSLPRAHRLVTRSLLALSLLVIAFGSFRPIFNADVWWHLASGRWMWEHHPLLTADPFSFTVLGHRWVDHEWLFEAVLYATFHYFSFSGVLVFKSILLALSAAGVYSTLPPRWSSALKSVVVVILFATLQFRNMVRPDLISFALFPWFLRALLIFNDLRHPFNARAKLLRLWPYALGMVVWANGHAGFLLMWTVMLLAALSRLIEVPAERAHRNPFLWLLGVCVAVSMINPYGYHLLTSTWQTTHLLLTRDHDDFIEYTTTSYHAYPAFWIAMISATAIVGLAQWSERKVDLFCSLLMLYSLWVGYTFQRNIPFALSMAVALACRSLASIDRSLIFETWSWSGNGLTMTGLVALILFQCPKIHVGVDDRLNPVTASRFVQSHLASSHGYNDYNFGGYWMWSLYGQGFPVFIDGRMHAVDGYPALWQDVKQIMILSPDSIDRWKTLANRWDFHYAVIQIPRTSLFYHHQLISFFSYLFPVNTWALVSYDTNAALYIRRDILESLHLVPFEIRHVFPDALGAPETPRPAWAEFFT